MDATVALRTIDQFVTVNGLRIRYIEEGQGPAVLLFHGASLGSSADVFQRNLGPIASAGFRVIAFDFPGYGLSDFSSDGSVPFKKNVTLGLIDALGLERVALVGHSQAGSIAVGLGLERPDLVSHVAVLGTGPLLPPLPGGAGSLEEKSQNRLEKRMSNSAPKIEDTRKLLEANLFHHELITSDELQLRHARSIGPCFEAFAARNAARGSSPKKAQSARPLYERLTELTMPLLMIYGREDRARAGARAELLKQQHPELNLHIVDGCKHLVPWDVKDLFHRLLIDLLKR